MALVSFKLILDDGTEYEGKMGLNAYIAAEKKFGVGAGKMESEGRLEHTVYAAWWALNRSGNSLPPFEEVLERVDSFEAGDKGEASTDEAASTS